MENKEKSYSITFISMATILFLILVSSTASAATAQSASFAAPYTHITNYDSKNFFIIDTVTNIVTDIVDVGYSSAGTYNGNLIAPDEKGTDSKISTITYLRSMCNSSSCCQLQQQYHRGLCSAFCPVYRPVGKCN